MSLQVRRATPDDLSGVLEVFLACWRESYRGILPDSAVAAMSDERADALWRRVLASVEGVVLVAERDGAVVGVTRYVASSEEGAVHSLYVSPRAHGGGIGGALLARATDDIREAGAVAATLWVFAANLPSIGFYEAQGWRPDGTTRTQPEFGQPELRMRKEWT
ncbi:GNAT superfamily N-acetyltransferase [Microbacterium resistens]|uniref:GNAT superfamily N-acetyltransferase n=1 Tax=Microbacterium resistens TaxID=156977 RepID=A0ABU1S9B9_9MICO|nr:GNAT family N-acetyltransferase [Microbacterium resistens]MDR6866191.1 GNAT superfamily N-acetyltransferase [Microbacterium resistens]